MSVHAKTRTGVHDGPESLFTMLRNMQYSKERLERACYRAICMNTTTHRSIKQMLQKGLDQQPLPTLQTEPEKPITHSNIRGTDYYH